ncbi:MAG: TdeIII family type II restriction endonuclease [Alistipes sp.]|nr:TdeIII family type II restriction endonuclease [Alistipes sp.]
MALTNIQIQEIETVLKNSLRHKFLNYNPEPAIMPFHTRLLGRDRLALFSFIHSLNTNFGTSIFEPVAIALAKNRFAQAQSQFVSGNQISESAQRVIQTIMDNLAAGLARPCKDSEIEAIRKVCRQGEMHTVKPTRVDVMLQNHNGDIFFFDIKSAKPNKGEFMGFKRTLLEWVGVTLAQNPQAQIHTMIAIPYNPYEPKPYSRWTMAGLLDLKEELKVAAEFWDFLGGENAYQDLLDCFERVGLELRSEIDDYFRRFQYL